VDNLVGDISRGAINHSKEIKSYQQKNKNNPKNRKIVDKNNEFL